MGTSKYRLIAALIAASAPAALSSSARAEWLVQTYVEPFIWNLQRADALIGGWGNAGTPATVSLNQWNTADVVGGSGFFGSNFPSPASGDNFAVQGTGSIIVSSAGDYRFINNTDDGSRLRIDGMTVILDDVLSPDHDAASAPIHLSAGSHSIEWTWFEFFGGAQGEVSYQNLTTPGTGRQLLGMAGTAGSANGITLDASAVVTGYQGNVSLGNIDTLSEALALTSDPSNRFGSGLFPTMNSTQNDSDGCYPGGAAPPGLVSGNDDDFAVTATGYLRVLTEGDYHFAQLTDDGALLRIDGMPVIVDDTLHPADCLIDVKYSSPVHLLPGFHSIEFMYFERGGGASGEVFLVDANRNRIALLGDVDNGGLEITQSVPEPATLALLGIGLAGLALRRRRRAAS